MMRDWTHEEGEGYNPESLYTLDVDSFVDELAERRSLCRFQPPCRMHQRDAMLRAPGNDCNMCDTNERPCLDLLHLGLGASVAWVIQIYCNVVAKH